MRIHNSKLGFTLIELLVTITIITILATIGAVIYSSVLKTARDSKRLQEVENIAKQAEMYFVANRVNPVSDGGTETSIEFSGNWRTGAGSLSQYLGSYFASGSLPIAPLNGESSCSGNICQYVYTDNMWCNGGTSGPQCSSGIPAVYTYLENCTNTGEAALFGYACPYFLKRVSTSP